MSAILDRLPALATTGVGSLPFARPAEAARHALGAYAVPFCPQLPRLDGDMVSEWLGADPGRCGWTADRDRERPAAWDAFVEQLAAKPPDHGMVKAAGHRSGHAGDRAGAWRRSHGGGRERRLARP